MEFRQEKRKIGPWPMVGWMGKTVMLMGFLGVAESVLSILERGAGPGNWVYLLMRTSSTHNNVTVGHLH